MAQLDKKRSHAWRAAYKYTYQPRGLLFSAKEHMYIFLYEDDELKSYEAELDPGQPYVV